MRATVIPLVVFLGLAPAPGCRPSAPRESASLPTSAAPVMVTTPAAARERAALELLSRRPYRRRPAPAGGAGAATLRRPALVLALHGYGNTSNDVEATFALDELADAHRYALAIPEGTPIAAVGVAARAAGTRSAPLTRPP